MRVDDQPTWNGRHGHRRRDDAGRTQRRRRDRQVGLADHGCRRCPVQLDPRRHQQRTERRDRRGRQRHDPGAVRSAGRVPAGRTQLLQLVERCAMQHREPGGRRLAARRRAGQSRDGCRSRHGRQHRNGVDHVDRYESGQQHRLRIDRHHRHQSLPPTPPGVGSGAPTPQLPRTGNSSLGGPLTLASLLVAGGMFSLVIGRRRRAAAAQ